jgi:hypothetical protein
MAKFRVFFITIFLVLSLFVLNPERTSASDFATTNGVLSVRVNKDFSVNTKAVVTIVNNDKSDLISGYEMILPFDIADKNLLQAELNSKKVTVKTVKSTNGISIVEIDFGSNVIKPKNSKSLLVEFQIKDYLYKLDELHYTSLRSVDSNFEKLIVDYDKELGSPSILIATDQMVHTNQKIEITSPKSLLIAFGNEYTIGLESKFNILNNSDEPILTTWNLIPNFNDQKLEYESVLNAKYALSANDKSSIDAVSEVDVESKTTVGFKASIYKQNVKFEDLTNSLSKEFEINSKVASDLQELTENLNNSFERSDRAQEYIVSNFKITPNSNFESKDLEDELKSASPNSEISSLEACLIISNVVSENDKTQIEYGYSLLDSTPKSSKTPHFWCVVSSGETIKLYDPFLEYVTGINYSSLGTRLDRVTFGSWKYQNEVSNNLGLTSVGESLHPLEVITKKNVQSTNRDLMEEEQVNNDQKVKTSFEETSQFIDSGLFFSIKFKFDNLTNQILRIESLDSDKFKFYGDLGSVEDYHYALLPNQVTEIRFKGFRINNFLANSQASDEIEFKFSNDLNSKITVQFYFKPKIEAIVGFVILLNVVGFGAMYLGWRKFIRNK